MKLKHQHHIGKAFFVAGKFGAAQGIKGEVRVISFMENKDDIFDSGSWYIPKKAFATATGLANSEFLEGYDSDLPQPARLELVSVTPSHWRHHSKGYAVALPGLSDRNQSQLLTHQLIYLPIENLLPLGENTFYWRDLIGLTVLDLQGAVIGAITEMLETGANDVMVVVSPAHGRVLVPFIPESVIKNVDLKASTIVLDWDFQDN